MIIINEIMNIEQIIADAFSPLKLHYLGKIFLLQRLNMVSFEQFLMSVTGS